MMVIFVDQFKALGFPAPLPLGELHGAGRKERGGHRTELRPSDQQYTRGLGETAAPAANKGIRDKLAPVSPPLPPRTLRKSGGLSQRCVRWCHGPRPGEERRAASWAELCQTWIALPRGRESLGQKLDRLSKRKSLGSPEERDLGRLAALPTVTVRSLQPYDWPEHS